LSLHKYMYAHANPVVSTDPSGLVTKSELAVAFKAADILFTLAFPDPISVAMLAAPPGVPAAFAKGLGNLFGGVARGAIFSRAALGTARFGQAGKDSVDATRAFMTAKNIKPPFISDEYLQSLKAYLPSRTASKVADFVSEGSNGLIFVEAKSAITTNQLANSINAGGKMVGTRNLVEAVYQRGGQAFPGIEKQVITATDVSKIPIGASAGKISKVPTSVPGEYQVFQNGAPAMPNGVPVFLQQL